MRWPTQTGRDEARFVRRLLAALAIAIVCVSASWSDITSPASAAPSTALLAVQQPQPPKPQDEFVPVSELPPQDQLPAAPLLVTAYAFVWIVLFAYVLSVSRRLSRVQREVERLDADIKRGVRS